MAFDVAALLDKAQLIHRLPSDYKLALVMGIDHKSLSNYRHGKTLPDARVIGKICELTGDDAALLLAQIEAERAKTTEARALWLQVVERLQSTLHAVILSTLFGGAIWGGFPSDIHAKTAQFTESNTLHIVEHGRSGFSRLLQRLKRRAQGIISRFFGSPCRVSRPASTAAA